MRLSIAGARKNVYLEMYIVSDDAAGRSFLAELENAAKRGVKVIALLDTIGSIGLDTDDIQELRAAGAEVLFCSFFFRRMHRKILIVDESVAFVGGVNVGKSYAKWKDLQIRLTGNIVHSMIRSFDRVYKSCGGKSDILAGYKVSRFKKARLWLVDHGIGKKTEQFKKYYEARINGARESIILVTPYLLPPRWFMACLHQALIRGVKVEIILPQQTDYAVINSINYSFASFLTERGATCYLMPGMNHAKAMLVDRREGIIGSQNLDRLSFNWNMEAGVFFHEPTMVKNLESIVSEWKAGSVIFNQGKTRLRWYDYPMAFILRLFGILPLE
jgi:cardiolipin synthase